MHIHLLTGFLLLSVSHLFGQATPDPLPILATDTLTATVTAFGQYRLESAGIPGIKTLQGAATDRYNKTSLVQAFNTLPGVRMEERSPGSYRISMRGSSLRSPFGVRNIKVYYNDIPLTDPGGNTYFNQLAFNNFSGMELAKGPGGSLYGAGTGGVILIHSLQPWQAGTTAELIGGSYGLLNVMGTSRFKSGNKKQAISVSHTQHEGYRDQTAMRRTNMAYSGDWIQQEKYQLSGHVLATDMYYQTPGGLTLTEYQANPRQARPRVGTQPSAAENKAAIFQQNVLAGINQTIKFNHSISNKTTLYGAYAQIKNPSIRNYEKRSEPHGGGRTVFEGSFNVDEQRFQWIGGGEAQWGQFNTRVFTNVQGNEGNLQTDDELRFATGSIFTQLNWQSGTKWDFTAGISQFQNRVSITRTNVQPVVPKKRTFKNEWAPRLQAIYRPAGNLQLSAVISRGFSPPTVAELLPSTSVISTNLDAENGWNYEAGIRWKDKTGRWSSDINLFRFMLNDALVQRRDSTGADFYTNAGGTRQQGIEWSGNYLQTWSEGHKLALLSIKTAYTYSHFRYTTFKQLENDFAGNRMPSVPAHSLSLTADWRWRSSFFIQTTFFAASSIWLNDANTQKANAYQLVGLRAGYGKKWQWYAGADNLLNQIYSLGNDINAFGGRYYNTAAARNFYAGLRYEIPHRN